MTYENELRSAMKSLADLPNTVFVGQAVAYPGTAMFRTLGGVPKERLLEFPVAEDFQLGFCTGLSLAGMLPICCYPRFNFLLLAINQLVNHLDKIPMYSEYRPKVIIRVSVGHDEPMNPGPQHLGDYSVPLRMMLKNIVVSQLESAEEIKPAFERALWREESTVLVEYAKLYA